MLPNCLLCYYAGQRHYVSQIFNEKWSTNESLFELGNVRSRKGDRKTGFGKWIGLKEIISFSKAVTRK